MNAKTDTVHSSAEALRYPWEQHPGPDEVVEIRPGVLWVRLKLPFRLNHVNIYLLADGDGAWAVTIILTGRGAEPKSGGAPVAGPYMRRLRRWRSPHRDRDPAPRRAPSTHRGPR